MTRSARRRDSGYRRVPCHAYAAPCPRALARLILSALLACLPASFAARAQGADESIRPIRPSCAPKATRCARVARLSPAVQAQNKQVAQAILAGDWPVAERLGADMARLDPANADIRHFQGRLLALQKRYAPAIENSTRPSRWTPATAGSWSARPARRRMPAIWRAPCAARRPCANAFPTGASATTCGPLCWTAWTARPKRWPRMSAPSPRTRQRADTGQPGHAVAPAGPPGRRTRRVRRRAAAATGLCAGASRAGQPARALRRRVGARQTANCARPPRLTGAA